MMKRFALLWGIATVILTSSCTERRTASAPVPDGDTIEVVIPDKKADKIRGAKRVIVSGPTAEPMESDELVE